MNSFSYFFLASLMLAFGLEWWLAQRQIRHVFAHQDKVPDAFADKIDILEHQKAAKYTIAKTRFAQKVRIIELGILLAWLFGGGIEWLDTFWRAFHLSNVWTGVMVLSSFFLISSLLDLPVGYYKTFKLEEKFGFNRITPQLFFTDLFKSFLLSTIITIPLLAIVLWLMESMGTGWWLWVWMVWMSFSVLMMWAYPAFIAPLFNKFNPLEEGALKQRIESLLQRNGFASQGIFVMDGSKRTGHGNAYFTGLGNNKRIVFFDTLLDGLSESEIEAVLAHEVGHFKRKHVQKRFLWIAGISLLSLAILGQLMQQTWFYHGLGVSHASTHSALLLFMLIAPVFSFFLHPLSSYASRQHEFEADNFAAEQADATMLIHALVKLYKENASTLTPDPLYSTFYDSHPPAMVRIAHLNAQS
jgi:STE24 endopeptidase